MRFGTLTLILLGLLAEPAMSADKVLHPGTPQLDRPTLMALGIRFPISGDDNHNATVSVRYRKAGTTVWKDALPLFRVRPETVKGWKVEPQFAGSIFDLRSATTYEIELHAVDPDGKVDQVFLLTGTTRAVPSDPVAPRKVPVNDAASFKTALAGAQPGDIILLAKGVYAGEFVLKAAGTPSNPVVIRGESTEGAILDGGNCDPCNVLEVYGAGFVHVERLSIRNASRALRFQTAGAEANVVRRVHISNVTLGIAPRENQKDFYIADNIVEGRLKWPSVYTDDDGKHSDDDGIQVMGSGHVVCHNRISGFGDAMKTAEDGARSVDFYGNEVVSAYDNALELDGAEGNARCLRNRFTNTYAPLSVQPVFAGPAYLVRNVVVNIVHEQMKFHSNGVPNEHEPNGVFAYHNTFVSPDIPLKLESGCASHHFAILNNLFVGPAGAAGRQTAYWSGTINDGVFDYNGYLPDGNFRLNLPSQGGFINFPSFAALQRAGLERHGLLLSAPVFANGLVPPTSYEVTMTPPDASLHKASNAIDRGRVLPNINDNYTGAAPDLGALEIGCPLPIYGPRPEGVDESNEPLGCEAAPPASQVLPMVAKPYQPAK